MILQAVWGIHHPDVFVKGGNGPLGVDIKGLGLT